MVTALTIVALDHFSTVIIASNIVHSNIDSDSDSMLRTPHVRASSASCVVRARAVSLPSSSYRREAWRATLQVARRLVPCRPALASPGIPKRTDWESCGQHCCFGNRALFIWDNIA